MSHVSKDWLPHGQEDSKTLFCATTVSNNFNPQKSKGFCEALGTKEGGGASFNQEINCLAALKVVCYQTTQVYTEDGNTD